MTSFVVLPRVVHARLCAALAGAWSGVFAVVHAYWAVGGRVFLGTSPQADAAFARPAFAIYNGVVAVLCVVGVAAAVALLAAPRPSQRVMRLATAAAWIACVLLVLRGGASLVQGLLGLAPPASQQAAYNFDPWFLLGGALFGLAAVAVRAATAPQPRHPTDG